MMPALVAALHRYEQPHESGEGGQADRRRTVKVTVDSSEGVVVVKLDRK